MHLAAQLAQGQLVHIRHRGLQQGIHRKAAHRQNDLGLQQLNLSAQIGIALRHFGRLGVAVARRTAFDNVGDVDIAAPLQAHGLEHVIQQLAGLAHKRLTDEVFVLTGCLTHDQPVHLGCQMRPRGCLAYAEHRICALFAELAGLAGSHRLLQGGPIHSGNIAVLHRLGHRPVRDRAICPHIFRLVRYFFGRNRCHWSAGNANRLGNDLRA